MSTGNTKYDEDKAPVYQGFIAYFPRAMEAVAAVSAFGAKKYAWNGWRNIPDGLTRITNALSRHFTAEAKGELVDPESKFLHAQHTAWNAMARLELLLIERENGSD